MNWSGCDTIQLYLQKKGRSPSLLIPGIYQNNTLLAPQLETKLCSSLFPKKKSKKSHITANSCLVLTVSISPPLIYLQYQTNQPLCSTPTELALIKVMSNLHVAKSLKTPALFFLLNFCGFQHSQLLPPFSSGNTLHSASETSYSWSSSCSSGHCFSVIKGSFSLHQLYLLEFLRAPFWVLQLLIPLSPQGTPAILQL